MQTKKQLEAAARYRKTKKGKLASQRSNINDKGRARAVKYFHSEKGYSRYLRRVFGMEYQDWKRMHELLGGRCAICRKQNNRRLSIDHDHESGKIRGLLCDSCNKGLGHFKDNPENLRRAAHYIDTNKRTKDLQVILFD